MTMSKRERSHSTHSFARELLLLLCAVGLISLTLSTAPRPGQAQAVQAKRSLTHQDYDNWRSIQGSQISRDGKFVAYILIPQDGDGEIVVRDLAKGEWRYGRGWRPPTPPPDLTDPTAATNFLNRMNRISRPFFTADSRYLIFTIEPNKADVLKARKEKKKPEEMPQNAFGIMDLSTGQVTRIERVESFQVPEEAPGFIAYLLESKPEEKKSDDTAATSQTPATNPQAANAPGRRTGRERRKEYGSDLVLRNLSSGSERTFPDALDYSLSKDAKTLVYTVSSRNPETNGVYFVTPGDDAPPVDLLRGKGKYSRLTWDEDQTELAFLSDRDDASAKQPKYKLYHWDRKSSNSGKSGGRLKLSRYQPPISVREW